VRILGIDPGYAIMGWGVIDMKGNHFTPVAYDSIMTQAKMPKIDRLKILYNELMNIMSIVSKLNTKNDDARTNLLAALKPHLSEPKREKVDTAIKILRLLELLPILKESGVLGKLL